MTQYTNNDDELVFLNDKNIASARTDILSTIAYNAIPSLSLFNTTYEELTGRDFDIETSANGISAIVTALSDSLSNFMGKSYNELSSNDKYLSSEISGTAKVFSHDALISNKVKIVEVTNAEYNLLIVNGTQEDAAVYVIEDSYYSTRGCKIKDLADPTDLSDATNKFYVDSTAATAKTEAISGSKSYADGISSELCNTIGTRLGETKEELSNTLSSYANSLCSEISTDIKNSGYAIYDNFSFEYNVNDHKIVLTLKDQNDRTKSLSVDSTDFIKNRILDKAEVTKDTSGDLVLRLWWKKSPEETTGSYTDIKIKDLTKIYTGGFGIDITDDLTISIKNTIATKALLEGVSCTVMLLSTTTYETLTGNIDTVSCHVRDIQGYINDLSAENNSGILYKMNSNIDTLCSEITANTADKRGIKARLNNVENNAASLQLYADKLSSDNGIIDGINGDIEALGTKTGELQWYADYLSGFSSSPGKIAEITADINIIDGKIDAKEPRLASVEDYVDRLSSTDDADPGIIKQINANIANIKTDLTGNNLGSTNYRLISVENKIIDIKSGEDGLNDTRATIRTLSASAPDGPIFGPITILTTQYNSLLGTLGTHTNAIAAINTTTELHTNLIDGLTNNVNTLNTWKTTHDKLSASSTLLGHIKIGYTATNLEASMKYRALYCDPNQKGYVLVPVCEVKNGLSVLKDYTNKSYTFSIKDSVIDTLKDIDESSELTAIGRALNNLYIALTAN